MADPAARKIKIVSDGWIPANILWARANLISVSLQLRGAASDLSAATFQIADESHTMGNALRWMIMKKYASVSISIVSPCSPAPVQRSNSAVIGKYSHPLCPSRRTMPSR